MSQLDTTHTFVDGDIVHAADLNNMIDQAAALTGLIAAQTIDNSLTPATDYVMYFDSVAGLLKRCSVQNLPSGVTSVAMTCNPVSVFGSPGPVITGIGTLTVSLDDQLPNKVLAGPDSGTTAATPSFRLLKSADTSFPTFSIPAALINWSLGNVFEKTLTAPLTTFHFSNVKDGQTIRVRVKQSSAGNLTAAWDPDTLTLIWCGGVTPVMPTGPNSYGIFVFTAVTNGAGVTVIHGFFEQLPANTVLDSLQLAKTFLAGPVSGPHAIPAFRQIALSDLGTQSANEILAGPVSGADAAPTFRAISSDDIPALAPANITTSATIAVGATVIDLTLSNYWIKQLSGVASTITLKLNGGIAGQEITVFLFQGTAPAQTLVNWDTDDIGGVVRWPGGTHPVMTHGTVGNSDIYHFVCAGSGLYFGTFDQNFLP